MADNSAGSVDHLRTLALDPVERSYLHRLAAAGGEQPFTWNEVRNPRARAMLVRLINIRLIKEVEYVTHLAVTGRTYMRLTDDGRAALAFCENAEKQLVYAKAPVVEAAPSGGLAQLEQDINAANGKAANE